MTFGTWRLLEFVIQYTLRMMIELWKNLIILFVIKKANISLLGLGSKSDDVELPENFDVAFGRMKSLSRKL